VPDRSDIPLAVPGNLKVDARLGTLVLEANDPFHQPNRLAGELIQFELILAAHPEEAVNNVTKMATFDFLFIIDLFEALF